MAPPVEFHEDEAGKLVLRHVPDSAAPPDAAALAAAAAAAGYADRLLEPSALDEAARRIGGGEEFSLPVGCRTDAEYRVQIAPDKMSATLTIVAAHGGRPADMDGAGDALAKAGVIVGIDTAALAEALANPGTALVVARGAPPRNGVDGRLETLIELDQARHLREDDRGHVDFRELGLLRSVAAGTPLMRRHPPQPGISGQTVLGVEVPVPNPKDAKFPVRLQGVQVSTADPDLLVAAIAGQPVAHRDGIGIDPVLVLPGVNLATGNVDFVGTVEVKGDVQSGMKIHAGGDVIIHGTLEAAEIDAGGEVEVRGGAIGHRLQTHGHGGDASTGGARIHAKGSVHAHHVENAVIVAEQSVVVDESIVQSDVTAMEEVIVGKDGGRKGHVIGGIVRAHRAVTANCLGATGSGETGIVVGLSPLLLSAIEQKKAAVEAALKAHDDLEKVVKVLLMRPDKADMLAKARLTLDKTAEELADLMADQRELEAQLKLAERAEVVVKSTVHPGVSVTIGHRRKVVTEVLGAGTFRLMTEEVGGREEEVVVFGR